MKMKPDHVAYIRDCYSRLSIDGYRNSIVTEGRAKDIGKRLRWDLLYVSPGSQWVCSNLYSYLDDTHIDTALRSIMRGMGY